PQGRRSRVWKEKIPELNRHPQRPGVLPGIQQREIYPCLRIGSLGLGRGKQYPTWINEGALTPGVSLSHLIGRALFGYPIKAQGRLKRACGDEGSGGTRGN